MGSLDEAYDEKRSLMPIYPTVEFPRRVLDDAAFAHQEGDECADADKQWQRTHPRYPAAGRYVQSQNDKCKKDRNYFDCDATRLEWARV